MPDIVLASGEFKIMFEANQYGVFMNNRPLDWFPEYKHASKLTQDLFVARATTSDDTMIGAKKFCPSGLGNGQIVIVVAKSKNGYFVQPVGTDSDSRMEVTPDVLTDPPPAYTW